MEEFRQKGNILFWSFIQGFIYRGRMCCCLEGSVLAVGGECEAIRSMSVCETPEGWKDCEFSPCKTPLRTLKSLSWAKDGTNQRKQQRHFNKHTQTHMLSHSANRLFRSFSWSRLRSHDCIYPALCTERCRTEDEATGCGSASSWALFSSSFSLHHSPFPLFHRSLISLLLGHSLSYLSILLYFSLSIYRGSWWDSGTCTYRRHREVCVHSPGCSWGPVRGVPLGSSSGRPLLQGMGTPVGC